MIPYVDTSALAKLYVNEAGSSAFQTYVAGLTSGWISRLTFLEFRCLLARRVRAKLISSQDQASARGLFESDIARGLWEIVPLDDQHVTRAATLIDRLAHSPLRTLDAIHLAVAQSLGASELATSDQTLASAGGTLGLRVAMF
jgi:predicted nucleic acid-binding protein